MERASIDQIVGGIYRISLWSPHAGLTFNQFLIDDEAPTLVHTGRYDDYDAVAAAIGEVLDPARLANIVLLHWEGDENGGMDRFMSQAKDSELVGSALSIALNATGFGLHTRTRGFRDGETLDLGGAQAALHGDPARPPLGFDDGRRGDDRQPVLVRSVPPAGRAARP